MTPDFQTVSSLALARRMKVTSATLRHPWAVTRPNCPLPIAAQSSCWRKHPSLPNQECLSLDSSSDVHQRQYGWDQGGRRPPLGGTPVDRKNRFIYFVVSRHPLRELNSHFPHFASARGVPIWYFSVGRGIRGDAPPCSDGSRQRGTSSTHEDSNHPAQAPNVQFCHGCRP